MHHSDPPFPRDRLSVFVPAVMSVGMLFWIFTLVRELAQWRGRRAVERRGAISGHVVAEFVTDGPRASTSLEPGLRERGSYLLTAAFLFGTALYILVGATLNYVRAGGYVQDIAWLLTLSVVVSAALGFLGSVAAAVWYAWPNPPRRYGTVVLTSPLSRAPERDAGVKPRWELTAATLLTPFAALVLALLVSTSRTAIERVDRPVALWLQEMPELDVLRFLDPLGSTPLAIGLMALVGLATLRCRLLFLVYPFAVAFGLLANVMGEEIIERPRPPTSPLQGLAESFPSGHVIQSVLIAGLFPLALAVLLARPRVVAPLRTLLFVGVGAGALHRIHQGFHWPSDVIAAVLIGLSLVLAADWLLAHRSWHRTCRSCVWNPGTKGVALFGAIPFHPTHAQLLRWISHFTAAAAVVGLTVLTLTKSVPSNPDGSLLGTQIQIPVQLALAGVVSIGALVSWKWDGVGAVLIAFGATGLGVFAGLEYDPAVAVAMWGALMIPAGLLWLSWQHNRTWIEIFVLAAVTVGLLAGTWTGADAIYGYYYGPTHPVSAVPAPDVDAVRWAWSGNLASDRVTVVAHIERGESARLRLVADDGGAVETSPVVPDAAGVVRLEATGLAAGTHYTWQVVVDGHPDTAWGAGEVRTPAEGAMSFTVAAGSCARIGSNGAVFDAIAAQEPLLYLALGDLHYSNLESTDPADFVRALEVLLTQPGQARLYRETPVAYVWDDHDYGPNDADSASPSRDAARAAFREAVPHYPLLDSGAIYQAFTIGRVRFVLTDSRSERTDTTMLGADQLEWLIDELVTASRTHGLVVWGNPIPWIGDVADAWGGYPAERRQIAEALAEAGVDNLVMVSGDAHMVALDDGTNSAYDPGGAAGFPVLHAAPLDRPGSVKGGPYSHGTFPYSGQFGTLEIVDSGSSIEVTLTGWNWEGQQLVSETFLFGN